MDTEIRQVVIVGGGTAGWLTAGVLASEHRVGEASGFQLTLIESPDISPLGVGEGTWPSMRSTLQKMGVSETEFIRQCDASFKQGSRFAGWSEGGTDFYYHPFSWPQDYAATNLVGHWQTSCPHLSFADAVCPQGRLCEQGLAPKQISTPEFAFNLNYGYHLDAGKFAQFLQQHCVKQLGVKHVLQQVTAVNTAANGDIASLGLASGQTIAGDLFIDCSGFAALLLGQHYRVPFCDTRDTLFNDCALAAQVPYSEASDSIASHTLGTAQSAGWVWDIGLQSRRGVGYVYSSAHCSDTEAEAGLRQYLKSTAPDGQVPETSLRKIAFKSGYRQKFWQNNCVAVGVSAGFVEPLEASALALIELSARMISEQLPANRRIMDLVAKRFNEKFTYRWQRIVDFLKLHYVLTKRQDSDFWRDHSKVENMPQGLRESLSLWRYHAPWHQDTPQIDEIFPSASLQYVLYGMGFETAPRVTPAHAGAAGKERIMQLFRDNDRRAAQLQAALPYNRQLIDKVLEFGFPKI